MTGRDVATVPKERVDGLARMISTYQGTFARLLPDHLDPEAFVGIAAGAMYRNPKLALAAMAHPESLFVALRDCARLGHEPGTKEYALTLRGGKVAGLEQYQGVIERMYRSGAVHAVHAEVICKGETFIRRDPNPPLHEVPDAAGGWLARDTTVGNLVGVYAYAILDGGVCSRVVVMGRAEVMRHRDVAETKNIWDGPFGMAMWLKTAAHTLENWVPTSAQYRRQAALAAAEAGKLAAETAPAHIPTTPPADAGPSGFLEGDVVDQEGWPDVAQPPDRRAQ
jgi:recombination protein RecT